MITSTFGCCGSVNNRNLVPDTVWKHVRRKSAVSRTSMPVNAERGMGRLEALRRAAGVRERVIA